MKAFSESRAVIIGMGFLMEYIFPCFRAAMGEKVKEQVVAVTADTVDLEGKEKRLGIRVVSERYAAAKPSSPSTFVKQARYLI